MNICLEDLTYPPKISRYTLNRGSASCSQSGTMARAPLLKSAHSTFSPLQPTLDSHPFPPLKQGASPLKMNPFERFSRPPQNTPVDPRLRDHQHLQRLQPQPTPMFPPISSANVVELPQTPQYRRQSIPQNIPRPPVLFPPPQTPQHPKQTFVNNTPTSSHSARKPRLKIDQRVDMCILRHVLSYKPYCVDKMKVSKVWGAVCFAIANEMPSLTDRLSIGSIKYRYKRLMDDYKLFADELVRQEVEENGPATKKRRLYEYERLGEDIKDMCKRIDKDVASAGFVNPKGKEDEDADADDEKDDEKDDEEEDHVSPVGYPSEDDIAAMSMRSNDSSKTNLSASLTGNINRTKTIDTAVPDLKTSESPMSVRFPLDQFTTITPQAMVPTYRTPINEQHHDEVIQLQRQFLAEQKRRNDLLEEDLKWKWEFLAVLKQRNNEIDDGVLMMLGRGVGDT